MNMKKLVVSLAVAGVMVSPLTQAAGSLMSSHKGNSHMLVSKAVQAKAAKAQSDLFLINNTISLEQAHQAVAAKSAGRLLGGSLNLDFGAPSYEFLLLEGDKLKYMVVSAETAAVVSEESFADMTLTTPSITLSQAIAAAESATSATVYGAQLEQDESQSAYRVTAGTKDADFDVVVSSTSGKVIVATKDDWSDFEDAEGEGEGDGNNTNEPTLITVAQAMSAAEQAISGTVIGVSLDFGDEMDDFEDDWEDGDWEDDEGGDWEDDEGGDMEDDEGGDMEDDEGGSGGERGEDDDWEDGDWEDDEGGWDDEGDWEDDDWGWKKGTKGDQTSKAANKDDESGDEQTEEIKPTYMVEVADGKYIHMVMVDAVSGKATEVVKDPEQAFEAAIKAQTKWANVATVIANAKAAQAGHMEGIDLELAEDGKLVYAVYIEASDKSYVAIVDAAEGTVIKVDTFDFEIDDEMGDDEGEGDGGGNAQKAVRVSRS